MARDLNRFPRTQSQQQTTTGGLPQLLERSTKESIAFQGQTASGNSRMHVGHHYNSEFTTASAISYHIHLFVVDNYTNKNYYSLRQRRSDETLRESQRDDALLTTASHGHTPRVAYLLRLGADVDHSDDRGFTALHFAALTGFQDTMDALSQGGANIEAQSLDLGTSLHLAAWKGHGGSVRFLQGSRANVNAGSKFLGRPLHCASFSGSLESTKALLQCGADPKACAVVERGHLEDVLNPIQRKGRWAFFRCEPLLLAAMCRCKDLFDALLNDGASNNLDHSAPRHSDEKGDTIEATALHEAAFSGGHLVCRALLARKADVNARGTNGMTALMLAAAFGEIECVRVLHEYGSAVNLTDMVGRTTPAYAVAGGNVEIAELLGQRGASFAWRSADGKSDTLLHIAVRRKSPSMVTFLLGKGVKATVRNNENETAFDLALRLREREDGNISGLEEI